MEIVGGIIALIILVPLFLLFYLIARPKEEGTLQERRNNPELNTNKIELHSQRLDEFGKSKFRNDMYYIGPKGGCYYYSNEKKIRLMKRLLLAPIGAPFSPLVIYFFLV